MQKKETVSFVYFLAFTFLVLAVFGGLGFYNGYNSITGAAFEVNPFEGLLDGFRGLFQNSEIMGYILVFIAIFPIIWLLVSRVHIFQGGTNKWPGILVAVSMTLISMIFVPSFTETIIGIFVYSTFLALLIVILLLTWTAYSLLHKQVSEYVGEFAGIAGTRDASRATAIGAKGSVLDAKGKLAGQKANLAFMAQLNYKLLNIDKEIRSLNARAVQKGIRNKPASVKKLFDDVDDEVRKFKKLVNGGNYDQANELYTSISAHFGQLESLVK